MKKINNKNRSNNIMNNYLRQSFDITEKTIQKSPENENEIITKYNNYIINSKSNQYSGNKPMVRSSTYSDSELPIDINIHNNFQQYNNTPEFIGADINYPNKQRYNYDNYDMIPEYKYQPNNYYPMNDAIAPISFSYNSDATAAPVVPVSIATVAPIVPVAPATVAPIVPVSIATAAPIVPATVAPVVPATAAPVAPATAAPVATATVAPVVPATVAPVAPATAAPTNNASIQTFQNYFKDLRGGFKDYYAFNN